MERKLAKQTGTRACLVLLALMLLPVIPFAQEGALKGVVTDKQGAPLKDVRITLLDATSGNKYTVKTNKEGKFFKAGTPPGYYQVTVELEGYVPLKTTLTVVYGKFESLSYTLEKTPPKIDEDADFLEGVARFKQAQFGEAVGFFEKAAARYPESPEIFFNLGLSAYKSGDADKAISALEQAAKLKPDMVEIYTPLGESYFGKGDKDKAQEAFSRSAKYQPDNPKTYYNLGIVHYKYDRLDDALASFRKAFELDPGFGSAYYQAGLVSVRKGEYKEALGYFELFLKVEPNAAEAAQVKTMIEELKKRIGG